MSPYSAPIADMRFVLEHLAGLDGIAALPGHDEATPELVGTVLEEAGRLAATVLAPLNAVGDRVGCVLENGTVRTPPGFPEAYRRYSEGGWNGLPAAPEHGGQGLPWAVALAVQEMWQSANMGFGLCPLLNQGAVELIEAHGSAEQRRTWLPKLVSGEWTGTMALTEPQAGSDLGAITTRAVPDGTAYRITGQKIYLTYGEHDLAENIVHMVLARTPGAPAGSRGISLFIVPKFLVGEDGAPGARNDLRCAGLERKLGIHASPTCVMAFGDGDGAIGYRVGEEHRGLECMFTMMNIARLSVGLQGVAIAERAYQQARDHARARLQGRAGGAAPAAIIHHPDVRRMLLTMKAQAEAGRALAYVAAAALDLAQRHPDAGARAAAQARVDLLTPVVKAWCTELGVEAASLNIQVHGGMGYIEETGAAQLWRDARIAPIYEGTNGIQAADLAFRKLGRDGGRAARDAIAELRGAEAALAAAPGEEAAAIRHRLVPALDALAGATDRMLSHLAARAEAAAAVAVPYLRLFGTVAGGALLGRAAAAALALLHEERGDPGFLRAKLLTARFYADHLLPQAAALATVVAEGHHAVDAVSADEL